MRMRRKKNLEPRLERQSGITAAEPEALRGNWRSLFPEAQRVCLELGCGKGRFITQMARLHPENFYIAVERERGAAVMAMEKVANEGLSNVRFIVGDIQDFEKWFACDEIDDVYINFCDPWTKRHREKRRLTHRDFIARYRKAVRRGGHLYFKTDNTELFEFSVLELPEAGMKLNFVTRDLHSEALDNIMTEYEERFSSQGMKINYLEAEFV